MEVALISDTHVPSRASTIPEWVRERVRAADHVVHAGDFDSADALAAVRELSSGLTAVTGNMDPRLDLPAVATVELGGVEFVVTHGTGRPRGYEERVAATVADHARPGPTVGVSGHTHELLDTTVEGTRLLNPGSATGAAPASETSMMIGTVGDGEVRVTTERR
jgi:putative phosphoesterase